VPWFTRLTFKNRASYIYRTDVPLPSRYCILYIFLTNINTEYFKHAAHSPFFSSKCGLFHNATLFGSWIIHILHTGVLKFKCESRGAKRLNRCFPTADVRVRHQVSPSTNDGKQSGPGTGFTPSTSVLPCQYNSSKGGYTLVTSPRIVTPYRDSVDGTRARVTYQKLVTR